MIFLERLYDAFIHLKKRTMSNFSRTLEVEIDFQGQKSKVPIGLFSTDPKSYEVEYFRNVLSENEYKYCVEHAFDNPFRQLTFHWKQCGSVFEFFIDLCRW